MARILVVANRTAESPELLEMLKARGADGTKFMLVVPAAGHGIQKAADPDAAKADSTEHMLKAVERLRAEGLDVEGQCGDGDPIAAVQDALNFGSFDEVIVSTLPSRASKWLKMDLPTRVERLTGLPVTHIETRHAD
jgi:hypothetical protein